MTYNPDESKIVYKSRDAKEEKTFYALEWLAKDPDFSGAAMGSNVPNKGESRKAGLLWIRLS
jgi:hypothetical protein